MSLAVNHSIVPKEYTELEYLESNGYNGGYLELPIQFDNTDIVEVKASILEDSADCYFVSPSVWNDNNNRFAMGIHRTIAKYWYCCAYGTVNTGRTFLCGNTFYYGLPYLENDKHPHIWKYEDKKFKILDLKVSKDLRDGTDFEVGWGGRTANLRLFYGYNSPSNSRIYYYKHYRNGKLIADLVPCLRKQDGALGMYCFATKSFYEVYKKSCFRSKQNSRFEYVTSIQLGTKKVKRVYKGQTLIWKND